MTATGRSPWSGAGFRVGVALTGHPRSLAFGNGPRTQIAPTQKHTRPQISLQKAVGWCCASRRVYWRVTKTVIPVGNGFSLSIGRELVVLQE